MRRTAFFLIFLVAADLWFLASGLRAQTPLPFDELGAGPRATAMGQAFTAVADDASAAYYNPAGLALIRSPINLTLGYQYAKPMVSVKFDVEPVQNPYLGRGEFNQSEDLASGGLYVGYSTNFADVSAFQGSSMAERFAVGITLFANLPEINQFDNPQRPQDPYVFKYNERWALVAMAVSFGARVVDWLSVGGGILPRVDAYQESTGSWITLTGAVDPNDPSRGFRMDLRQTTKINVVPIGGILVKPPFGFLQDKVSLGFSYRGEIAGFYGTGPTSADVLIEVPGHDPIVVFDDPGGRTVDYIGFSPEQFTGGIAAAPLAGLTLAVDLTFKKYSAFHFFWDLPPEPPFHDVWVPRVGLRYAFEPGLGTGEYVRKFTQIQLLAGYYREPSPVPDMSGPMNILDADQNVISFGAGVQYDADWTDYVRLDVFTQIHLLEDNRIENDEDPLFGPVTVGGVVYNLGGALSVVY